MESSQAHQDLSSLLKIQENCNTETGYGILLFPSCRQISISPEVFMAPQRCPALQTPALLQFPIAIQQRHISPCLFKDSKFQSDPQANECFQDETYTSYQNISTPGFLLLSCPFCAFPESTYERLNY